MKFMLCLFFLQFSSSLYCLSGGNTRIRKSCLSSTSFRWVSYNKIRFAEMKSEIKVLVLSPFLSGGHSVPAGLSEQHGLCLGAPELHGGRSRGESAADATHALFWWIIKEPLLTADLSTFTVVLRHVLRAQKKTECTVHRSKNRTFSANWRKKAQKDEGGPKIYDFFNKSKTLPEVLFAVDFNRISGILPKWSNLVDPESTFYWRTIWSDTAKVSNNVNVRVIF